MEDKEEEILKIITVSILSNKILLEILGVDKGSTKDQIKKAYFKLAKEWHPDNNKAPGAKEKFSEIAE